MIISVVFCVIDKSVTSRIHCTRPMVEKKTRVFSVWSISEDTSYFEQAILQKKKKESCVFHEIFGMVTLFPIVSWN
jgi:hypothetical protein